MLSAGQALLHPHKQRLRDRAENEEDDHRDGQSRQDHQRERVIGEPQDEERAGEQDERLQRHDQPLTDEETHLFHVVGRADHQLAGLVAVVVAEREALDFRKQFVAEIEREVLRQAFGVELLAEREERAQDRKSDDADAPR